MISKYVKCAGITISDVPAEALEIYVNKYSKQEIDEWKQTLM